MTVWMNKTKAAEYIGISRPLLNEWIEEGLYCKEKNGRYFLSDKKIDEFIDSTGRNAGDLSGDIADELLESLNKEPS